MASQGEAKLSRKIIQALREHNVWCYKVWGNQMTPAGIPDIVGVFEGQFLGIETKMPGGKLSDIQKYRINEMRKAGAVITVARSVEEALELVNHLQHRDHDRCLMGKTRCPYLVGELR